MRRSETEFDRRFSAARAHRQEIADIVGREVYKFCFNGRETEWDKAVRAGTEPEEIFTDFAAIVAEEFHGDLFSAMTPENANWVSYEAGLAIPEDQVEEVTEQIEEFERVMNRAIRASNYYTEGQTAFQDAVVGTVALWVDQPQLSGPIKCRATPISKVYLRLGPYGLADRFFKEQYFTVDLPALLPDAVFSRELQRKIDKAKSSRSHVNWGFWPTFEDPENIVWRQEVRVDGEPVGMDQDLGEEGKVPLVVGRFNPVAGSAWGRGPGWQSLRDIRVLNAIAEMSLEGLDRTLEPAVIYPHDGMLDLSQGIEAGMGYPSMPGSADSVRELGLNGALDYGFFSEERFQEGLRYSFFRQPVQRGKTPPSASQYIGEEQKELRRMARPAAPLWDEFGVGLLKRFEALLREPGGALDGVTGPIIEGQQVSVRPISPLERAQSREDVMIAQSIMSIAMESLGPEQAPLLIDGVRTLRNMKDKLNDEVVEFRSAEEIEEIVRMMQGGQGAPQE